MVYHVESMSLLMLILRYSVKIKSEVLSESCMMLCDGC